ncbi:MAG: polysaccharide biosynthesis/export family protein [Paracoccaceae bacterium]
MKVLLALATGMLLSVGLITPALAQGYAVKPGDTLTIEVLEDASLNRSVLVAPDGRISVPMAGTLMVNGQTVDAIGASIATQIASNFATLPHVFVSLQQLAPRVAGTGVSTAAAMNIYVVGEANKPGKLAVARRTTVLQLFAEMGGFSKFAATKRIQLRRTDARTGVQNTYKLNYDAIEDGSSTAGNTTLQSGDVIIVPQRKLFE